MPAFEGAISSAGGVLVFCFYFFAAFVPSTAGLIMAGEVVNDLAGEIRA